MKNKKINIFDYLDFKKFLSDLFEFEKETNDLTLRLFSRQAGFNSHSYFKYIIEGKKTISVSSVFKIAKGFKLSDEESQYLEYLVRFDQAETTEEKNDIYKKIIKVRPKSKFLQIEKDHYILFSKWYIIAIREMTTLPEFKEDYSWIAKNLFPNITRAEAREAVEILLRLQYLKRNEDGKLEQDDKFITTGAEVKSFHVINYHNSLLNLASLSMTETKKEWRDISSLSFVVNKEEFTYIKNKIIDFRREIGQYLKDRQSGMFPEDIKGSEKTLYNLNMQFFNSTKIYWKK
ncbi:MAG: TIGR02147 family protein [Spirochaetia bacterium]|nr:TIGR02147 family protein [Spirochaetia bacterium]